MPKKSDRKKLVAKLDKVFSEYVRKRDGYRSVVSGSTDNIIRSFF